MKWLQKLAKHFNTELDEDQLAIYTKALAQHSSYQIEEGFNRCLNECSFMPKLAEFFHRMPEQRYPPGTYRESTTKEPNVLDLNRPIAEEICPKVYGCGYWDLDMDRPGDSAKIRNIFAMANLIRYLRTIGEQQWMDQRDIEAVRRFV